MTRPLLIATVLLLWAAAAVAAPVVIVHPDVPEDEVDEKTLQRIYLGKKTRWDDGVRIVPVMLADGDLHEEFVEDLLDRSVGKFVTFWKQAVFTGRGVPPRAFDTVDELRFYVAQTPGAVGYVDDGDSTEGVKVLRVD